MISAVITGAGNSTRCGENKMLFDIQGKPLLLRTLDQFIKSNVDEIIVTARKEDIVKYQELVKYYSDKPLKIVEGGSERIISLYNGVKETKGDIIITHDGARPLTPVKLINILIKSVKENGAAMTAINPTATVKLADDSNFIEKTLLRKKTFIAQTPQGFKKEIILNSLEKAIEKKYFVATDDSEIVSVMTNQKIKIVEGDDINMKITYPSDLIIVNEIFKKINGIGEIKMRIGIGEDSHRFDKSKKLILGGILIKDCEGLEGNSDGDVLLHSFCNALTSAIGKGCISEYADEMCKQGITDSKEYLKKAYSFVTKKNYSLNNVSISIEGEKPLIRPYKDQIKGSIAKTLNVDKELIGLTANSGERLTSFGRGEGIKVTVLVSITKC